MATTDDTQAAVTEEESRVDQRVDVAAAAGLVLVLLGIAYRVVHTDSIGDAIPVLAMTGVALAMLFSPVLWRWTTNSGRRLGLTRVLSRVGERLAVASWLLPSIGFVVVITVLGERPDKGQGEFFSAAAQVIPVLALALAVETTAFRERIESDPVGRVTALTTLLLLAYGEFEALEGLADSEHDGHDAEIVWAALTAGALGIMLVSVRARPVGGRP